MAKQERKQIDMRIIAERVDEAPEVSDLVTQLESEAEREIAAGTVTFRWGREQIAVVKRAAALMGIPYQTYLKQVVFRQALADIEHAEAVLARH
jgi:predicted DNA binding CopG/RHH family protein